MEVLASRVGYPTEIVSDNGIHFTSAEFETYLQSVGTEYIRVTPYHPCGNGAVERGNRTVKAALQAVDRQQIDRAKHLQHFLGLYRSTPHTGLSPAELFHRRRIRTKLHDAEFMKEPNMPTQELSRRVTHKQSYQKKYADTARYAKEPNFGVGDLRATDYCSRGAAN